jgi:hypothetical protein
MFVTPTICKDVSRNFRTESITKQTTTINTRWEATQRVMAAELTKVAIQLHVVAESCTVCSSRSRWPTRKLFNTPSYRLEHLKISRLHEFFPDVLELFYSHVRLGVYLSDVFLFSLSLSLSWVCGPPSLLSNRHQGLLPRRLERPGHEADHSPSSVEIKNACSYASIIPHVFMAWYLVNPRDNFTFTLVPKLCAHQMWGCGGHVTEGGLGRWIQTWSIRWCIQKSPDWVDNEIWAYFWYYSLRSNTNGYDGKTH